jgi:hypothetical protein
MHKQKCLKLLTFGINQCGQTKQYSTQKSLCHALYLKKTKWHPIQNGIKKTKTNAGEDMGKRNPHIVLVGM